MSETEGQSSAFQALLELAGRSKHFARGLPAQVAIKPHWSGIGFSLMGRRFVAPMDEISEMLEVPAYTRLPGVQHWVRGVANVRGRLLPLFDLAAFFGSKIGGQRKQRRVLILDRDGLYSGLIVDQVYGMQHFPVDTFSNDTSSLPDTLTPFVQGAYRQGENQWNVFSPASLAGEPRFVNAAED